MKKRILSLILCGAMLCSLFVGCGSSEDKNTETENTQEETEYSTEYETEDSEVVEEAREEVLYTVTTSEVAKWV